MVYEFGNYMIDVDTEKTREFYSGYTYGCDCDDCRNFKEYAKVCPPELSSWFDALGIDIEKPSEIYYNFETKNGLLRYDGWYHLCGSVIKTDRRIEMREDGIKMIVSDGYQINDGISVSFHGECVCVPSGFPRPCIQMEITAYIPNLSEEKAN